MDDASSLRIDDIDVSRTLHLRRTVLRNHLPQASVHGSCDGDPRTWHLGAFRGSELVGVVSVTPEPWTGRPGLPAHRFRFMAVDGAHRGVGIGGALMRETITRSRAHGSRLLWANGRDSALDFYRTLGFQVLDDGFMDSTSQLPHHVVLLDI